MIARVSRWSPRRIVLAAFLPATLLLGACLSREERAWLRLLQDDYRSVAAISYDGEFHLDVRATSTAGIARDSVTAMLLRFATGGPYTRARRVVYLNYHDAAGTRVYQLVFNPVTQEISGPPQ